MAFLLSGEMAVAYFQAHFPRSFWPILNGGEPVVLFCVVYLYLFAVGAGPFSLDALLRRRRTASVDSDAASSDRAPDRSASRPSRVA